MTRLETELNEQNELLSNGENLGAHSLAKLWGIDNDRLDQVMAQLDKMLNNSLKRAREMFYELDADGSGELDPQELQQALLRFNIDLNEHDLAMLINTVDTDKSGTVSMGELQTAIAKWQASEARQQIARGGAEALEGMVVTAWMRDAIVATNGAREIALELRAMGMVGEADTLIRIWEDELLTGQG